MSMMGRSAAIRKASEVGPSRPGLGRIAHHRANRAPDRPLTPSTICPRSPAMLASRSGICIATSETGHAFLRVKSRTAPGVQCGARGFAQQSCSTSPMKHHMSALPPLVQYPGPRGFVVGIPRWHASGQRIELEVSQDCVGA
jgi:hypothetical protein